ncbi:MAG TPA: HD domain-containing protein [Bacteroidales bacterium]|jgi:GTP pyrophosphokinase|nr:HD domain-containing protein [Bacteroidales bacterium]MDI9573599.1 HD domain-containing protein [Bacteroidota bacterium]MBP9511234.1 HD domain-containing protein [Bacteroidales bacterium]MBP9587554.1 HD domain-containing protein [Bacteroidales bacterium]HNZ78434.1 HD domain-containing protein [Bacteroidales bacterium]
MNNDEKNRLASIVLAPYIQKAYALISISRKTGGNQFRHAMATMSILIDYHYIDSVLLKAAILHDLLEDFHEAREENIREIQDEDVEEVIRLVKEVTRHFPESKREFYERLLHQGSKKAKILKCADVISNLTDLHIDNISLNKIKTNLNLYEKFILPMALQVNHNMHLEIEDLIQSRRLYVKSYHKDWFSTLLKRNA